MCTYIRPMPNGIFLDIPHRFSDMFCEAGGVFKIFLYILRFGEGERRVKRPTLLMEELKKGQGSITLSQTR